MDRSRLIKVVIVVAIAVPLIVEGVTLFGLVSKQLGGDSDGSDDVPTPGPDRVGPGETFLEDTAQRETLSAATIDGGDPWTLTLTVVVNNTGDTPYELTLGAVTTGGGRQFEGGVSTGKIDPGTKTTVTAEWSLPSGSLPRSVSVTAVVFDGSGNSKRTIQREIRLATIPVQG